MIPNILYIKLPLYVADYLRYRYHQPGSLGIRLPETMHPAGRVIYEKAISNPTLQPLTGLSYTQRAMSLPREDVPYRQQNMLPSEYSRRFMVAFELPQGHFVRGRYVDCSDTMQLNNEDAQRFRLLATEEMMQDIDNFRQGEWHSWARDLGYKESDFANMLSTWFVSRDINLDHYEAILRVFRRAQEKEGNRPCDIARHALQCTDIDGVNIGLQNNVKQT